MSADTLTASSRNFYERTKAKVAWSIVVAAGSLTLLGIASASGGLANSASYKEKSFSDANLNDDELESSQQALKSGYGFGCFVFLVASFLLLVAALYMSPLLFGSKNEKKMINSPQEVDTSYAAFQENPVNSGSVPPMEPKQTV